MNWDFVDTNVAIAYDHVHRNVIVAEWYQVIDYNEFDLNEFVIHYKIIPVDSKDAINGISGKVYTYDDVDLAEVEKIYESHIGG